MECLISPYRQTENTCSTFLEEPRASARTDIFRGRANFVNDNNHLLQFFTLKCTIKLAGIPAILAVRLAFILVKVVTAKNYLINIAFRNSDFYAHSVSIVNSTRTILFRRYYFNFPTQLFNFSISFLLHRKRER